MAYKLRVTLRNSSSTPRNVVIHGGTVFEVEDPFSHHQNLVAVSTTPASIPPNSSQAIEIDTWCLNQSFAPPSNTPMRPTVLATTRTYPSQADVWDAMARGR